MKRKQILDHKQMRAQRMKQLDNAPVSVTTLNNWQCDNCFRKMKFDSFLNRFMISTRLFSFKKPIL